MNNVIQIEQPELQFDYFHTEGAEKFDFFQIPKVFFTDDRFSSMSTDSKLVYGLLLSRVGLSKRNNFIDESGRVYFYYSVSDLMDMLSFGKNKVISHLAELKSLGLLECKRQGGNKPNIYYLKDFSSPVGSGDDKDDKLANSENCKFVDNNKCFEENAPINGYGQCTRKFENQTSGGLKNKPQEVSKSNPIYNNNNYKDKNNYYARARNHKKNSFYFENQRNYDFAELERMVINKSFPGIPRTIKKEAVP